MKAWRRELHERTREEEEKGMNKEMLIALIIVSIVFILACMIPHIMTVISAE